MEGEKNKGSKATKLQVGSRKCTDDLLQSEATAISINGHFPELLKEWIWNAITTNAYEIMIVLISLICSFQSLYINRHSFYLSTKITRSHSKWLGNWMLLAQYACLTHTRPRDRSLATNTRNGGPETACICILCATGTIHRVGDNIWKLEKGLLFKIHKELKKFSNSRATWLQNRQKTCIAIPPPRRRHTIGQQLY